jgi:hypothetical protein
MKKSSTDELSRSETKANNLGLLQANEIGWPEIIKVEGSIPSIGSEINQIFHYHDNKQKTNQRISYTSYKSD